MKKSIVVVVYLLFSLVILSAGMVAQQKADEKVVCPVSGEMMLKSQAKATYEYEGKTYYFCCADCKDKFVKDPAKYTAQKAEMKEIYTCPMHPEVQSDKPGKCPKCGMNLVKKTVTMPMAHTQGGMDMKEAGACPMMGLMSLEGAQIVSENLSDGIVIRVTAKDPATVKKLQDMGAKIVAMHKQK